MSPARTRAGNYGKSCKDLTGADLGIVNCKVAVRDIRNLFEGLSLAAHLKEVLVVDEEVSLLGVTDVVYLIILRKSTSRDTGQSLRSSVSVDRRLQGIGRLTQKGWSLVLYQNLS